MAYYDDINTDYCPNCNVKVDGIGAKGYITDDRKCSSCGVALKIVSINVASLNEAPYTEQAIEIDYSRERNRG